MNNVLAKSGFIRILIIFCDNKVAKSLVKCYTEMKIYGRLTDDLE